MQPLREARGRNALDTSQLKMWCSKRTVFVGSCSSAISFLRRLWVSGTTVEKIRQQPDEVQRLVRATLREFSMPKATRGKREAIIK
jgi:hypothetical protein